MVAGEDLTRHSKGILHGLHAFEPPAGATIHPPFSAAARAAEAKEEAARDDQSPPKTPGGGGGGGGGGWALTALDGERGRSPSPTRGGAASPTGSYGSPPVTPTVLHGNRELLPRVDTPQSWLNSEFSMGSGFTMTTTYTSSVRPDSPDRVTVMTENSTAPHERRARPPTAYAIRQAAKEEREAKEAARAIAITSTRQEPFTWRTHLEMLQSKVQSKGGASYPGRPAARSGKDAYPTLPFPHVLRPTTAPINIDGEWLDPKAPGSPTYRVRPNTAEAFANVAGGRPGTAAAAAAAAGAAAAGEVRPGTVGGAMRGGMAETGRQEDDDIDEEDLVAILERRALAKKKRLERSKAESPRHNKYNAAGVTQTRFFQELQADKMKRRSRRRGAGGAAAAEYARSKLGVEPSVDPELAFMTQVRWGVAKARREELVGVSRAEDVVGLSVVVCGLTDPSLSPHLDTEHTALLLTEWRVWAIECGNAGGVGAQEPTGGSRLHAGHRAAPPARPAAHRRAGERRAAHARVLLAAHQPRPAARQARRVRTAEAAVGEHDGAPEEVRELQRQHATRAQGQRRLPPHSRQRLPRAQKPQLHGLAFPTPTLARTPRNRVDTRAVDGVQHVSHCSRAQSQLP